MRGTAARGQAGRPAGPARRSGWWSPRCRSSASSVFVAHLLVDFLVDDPPLALVLGLGPRVGLADRVVQLALELLVTGDAVGAERPGGDGGLDRAARLAVMAAVAEPAGGRQLDDVVEGRLDPLVRPGDLERADARGVDEERAARQLEQLAVGRRVAAARVRLADGGGGLPRLAEQGV